MEIKDPSIKEWELIAFFGNEHVSRSYGELWYDSDSLYEYIDNTGLKLSFAIHPIHLDVRVILSKDDIEFYDWQVCGATDVQYIEEIAQTKLIVNLNETDRCEIFINPKIKLENFSGSVRT
jgi:hypothetical protein